MRVNKTDKNLQKVGESLDDACGSLDNALTTLNLMTNIPTNVKRKIESIDCTAIVNLKNDIEELMNKYNEEEL